MTKTAKELAELMIGADLTLPKHRAFKSAQSAVPRLVVDRLTTLSPLPFGTDLQAVSFTLMPGRILGIAGVAGNGQGELMDALSGEVLAGRPEAIVMDDVPAGHMGARDRRRMGGCFVPEERNGHGAVTSMTLTENGLLSGYIRRSLTRLGLIDEPRAGAFASEIISRFDVRTSGPKVRARALSGGNLQKFLVGREVLQAPHLLVINQPTWGVDAGAAATIYDALMELAETGTAILIISQDLEEIFEICDEVAVIAGGRLSPPVPVAQATVEQIGLLMGGTREAEPALVR